MAQVELILLQRVEKLGQMGDLVRVKPGYARNFLLPGKRAIRANKANLERFEQQRAQLEAQNIKRRDEAERLAERVGGLKVVIIRQAGESGGLYGSVSNRDIADACVAAGLTINRTQVILGQPIKTLGLHRVQVSLHPEVMIDVTANVARSVEEAERQARGEAVGQAAEEAEPSPVFGLDEEQPDIACRRRSFLRKERTCSPDTRKSGHLYQPQTRAPPWRGSVSVRAWPPSTLRARVCPHDSHSASCPWHRSLVHPSHIVVCTVVLSIAARPDWPLLLAANRDEKLDRPWLPPGRHWPDQPDVVAGQDTLAGGTWLGINRAGLVAAVLNRLGSLGPAPGKRSRGELPLMALRHASAQEAADAIGQLDAGQWRSFNLVLADRSGAIFMRGTGQGRVASIPLPPGTHVVTAREPNDFSSPRVARNLPRFRAAPAPNPPDWSTWPALLADSTPPSDAAINIPPFSGFGTANSALVALGRQTLFLSTRGEPAHSAFEAVALPEDWG